LTILRGIVSEFDEPRGLGTVTSEGRTFFFHCTSISDGTRSIAVGTNVIFKVARGHLGRLEAREVTAL